ncbi:MAG: DUF1569 domain-containing protein [Candidatus Sulfotelmatobacter sp.]
MDSRLEELQQLLAAAVSGMSSAELSCHPPDKWCAAEVLEHLYLTYTGTIKGFEKVVAAGRPLASQASIGQRWRTLLVLEFGHLPFGRTAPATTRPRGLPAEQVRAEVALKIVGIDEIIAQCEQRFGRDTKLLDHPILGPLTAGQWRKFHLVHGRHHAKQIRKLRDQAT